MQKLVMTYCWFDGAHSHREILAFEYNTLESALADFKDKAVKARYAETGFKFKGQDFRPNDYFCNREYCPPTVQTLEQWFESEKVKK